MANTESVRVVIRNWEKFNPRKDVTRPSWFRVDHGVFEDPKFYDLLPADWGGVLYLLSQASKANSGEFTVNFKHAHRVGQMSRAYLLGVIKKLEQTQFLHVDVTATNADVTCLHAIQRDVTEQTNDTNTPKPPADFDLESLYRKYPRKLGKAKGMAKLKREVQSQDDFTGVSRAIDRYANYVRQKGTEEQFIKHFSTFINEWKDWLAPDAGTVVKPTTSPGALMQEAMRKAKQAEIEATTPTDPEKVREILAQAGFGKSPKGAA